MKGLSLKYERTKESDGNFLVSIFEIVVQQVLVDIECLQIFLIYFNTVLIV